MFFARIQKFSLAYANSLKRDYSLKSSFRMFPANFNSNTESCILCRRLPSDFFVLVPKIIVEEHSGNSEKFRYRNILGIEKGYHYFSLKFVCLTVPKNLWGKRFVFQKLLVSENSMHRRRERN